MDVTSGNGAEKLNQALTPQRGRLDNLSQSALSRGITLYQRGNYNAALSDFRRAAALSPYTENALKAFEFIAQTCLKLDKPEEAVKTYRRSVGMFPARDDVRSKLGNLYFSLGRYEEAEKEYRSALAINPSSTNYLYSLGQVYLKTNRADEAETVYRKVISLAPRDYSGYYGLGQAYAGQDRHDEAVAQFSEALRLKPGFAYAYVDRGLSYAAIGEREKASEDVKILEDLDKTLADDLRNSLYRISAPRMLYVNTAKAFNTGLGPGTGLADLDGSLATPGAAKDFSLTFYFDKDMSVASVENVANWSIGRTIAGMPGGAYNWGMTVPPSEVNVTPLPSRVTYDPSTLSAAVTFAVAQNAAGNGTIDPSHLVFRFYGSDAYGNRISPTADEFVGISRIV